MLRVTGIVAILMGVLVGVLAGEERRGLEFAGVSGTMRTSNTSHYSLEFTNTGDSAITALRGRVELIDDFGDVSAIVPVELTSRTRREAFSEKGEAKVIPFQIGPGETIHYVVIEFTDYSSNPIRFVRDEEGFRMVVDKELIVPLEPENAARTRFVVEDVIH